MKEVIVLFILVISIPLAYSISINELVSRYSFAAATQQMNVTGYRDFMIDKNGNNANDTLVFELATENTAGTFIFVMDLFDRDGILTNETSKTLNSGASNITLTFSSTLLEQSQFNYSIKIYNESRKLKYRKDKILTQSYLNYEEGFRIIGMKDDRIGKSLQLNVSVSSPENKSHVTTLFLSYSNITIFSKSTKSYKMAMSSIVFSFDSETMKRTHHTGNFTIPSIKIGVKTIKTNFSTKIYDFRDFAATSYINNFTDYGIDANGNEKFDLLGINASVQALKAANYTLVLSLYDLFDNLVEIKNESVYLGEGKNIFPIHFNGSLFPSKKMNGPYVLKNVELYENMNLTDRLAGPHVTGNYDFNDFESIGLPDITAEISVSDSHLYGIGNVTVNFTFSNIGIKPAFNVGSEMMDNRTFAKSNKSSALNVNSKVAYQLNFTNISDFEAIAIADIENAVEESNESNNAFRAIIKLNKRPILSAIPNISVNETAKILINLTASDPNGDNLSYSANLSKFSIRYNLLEWNTSVSDSGNYILKAAASDGYLNDTVIFRLIILDAPEKDVDNDGIDDDVDRLIGDKSHINTTINLSILIGNSANLSKIFGSRMAVSFREGNASLAEFNFNFSRYRLNLANVTMKKQQGNTTGSMLVRGLKIPEGTKTLYLDRLNPNINGVCVKEEEISTIDEISNDCSSSNEFRIECDGTLQGSYACTYNSTISKYKIGGLSHSGIVQFDYSKSASSDSASSPSSSSGSGSGSSGGGTACVSEWECGIWSKCADGFRNRKCEDENKCAFSSMPKEIEKCDESELVNAVKPSNAIKPNRPGKNPQPKTLAGITGNAVNLGKKPNAGIFIAFIEIVLIVGAYVSIRNIFK